MPRETRLICSLAKTWSADAVAGCILAGVRRKRFSITPGVTLTLMDRVPGIVIPLLRWYTDYLVKGLRKARRAVPSLHAELLGSAK